MVVRLVHAGVHCRRVDDGDHVVMENDDNQEQQTEEQLERDAGTWSCTGASSSSIKKHTTVVSICSLFDVHAHGNILQCH